MQLLGHSTEAMTAPYTHPTYDELHPVAGMMQDLYGDIGVPSRTS